MSCACSPRLPLAGGEGVAEEPVRGTTRPCPYCGEPVLAAARKCRHCREYLDPTARPAPAPDPVERMLLPVGRPFSAIAAGYLGLCSVLPLVGVLAIIVS